VNIVVIGSTSATGLHVLRQGVERGHSLVAFTRRPQLLADVRGLKDVVTGDGLNDSDVRRAVRHQDAVIAIVGSRGLKRTTVAADVMRNVVQAMQQENVVRLVCVSSYLLERASRQLAASFFKWLLRHPLADRRTADRIVMESPLEWTIVRPGLLVDKPATGRIRLQPGGTPFRGSAKIGRADLASVLLDIAEKEETRRKVLNVAW